jgi:hypothetical protein
MKEWIYYELTNLFTINIVLPPSILICKAAFYDYG